MTKFSDIISIITNAQDEFELDWILDDADWRVEAIVENAQFPYTRANGEVCETAEDLNASLRKEIVQAIKERRAELE